MHLSSILPRKKGESMNVGMVYPLIFDQLPSDVKIEMLERIEMVNQKHLHCDKGPTWELVHHLMIKELSKIFLKKCQKKVVISPPPTVDNQPTLRLDVRTELNGNQYCKMLARVKGELEKSFYDLSFTEVVLEALQAHILTPLHHHFELVHLLCEWVIVNSIYLPLGTHLIPAYMKDMKNESLFIKHRWEKNFDFIPEALATQTVYQMRAFLTEVAAANIRSIGKVDPKKEQPTAVMLSIKNGAGGHTAPTEAMAARLKEKGWRVETIHYDTDLSAEYDPYQVLGITFEDGTPMTQNLFSTRWIMQRRNRKVSEIVKTYVAARVTLTPDQFINNSGGDLLRHQIMPLNPDLIVTTLAYHWTWGSLAYRLTTAKTLLVSSDVYFHNFSILSWYRQKDLPDPFRNIHFTTMTEDIELLKSVTTHHERFFKGKSSMVSLYDGLELDSQISVIGAPIQPGFDVSAEPENLERLRRKWGVSEGTLSVCISRGKLGYDSDIIPTLEGYRTEEVLEKPILLQVVCGENTSLYERLLAGEFKDLGPNITIKPYPLMKPSDFAELRAISTFDDIKAGGGSTFEGWYLISKGIPSMLLLTPGAKLWWEGSNCDAMEKWGIGRTVTEQTNKITILKQVIQEGLPEVKNRFPDWKEPFDHVVKILGKK